MNIQFYNVKTKQKVSVPQDKLKKVKYERKTASGVKSSYALRAEVDGQKLTKFVSKGDWDKLDVPEEKVVKNNKGTKKPSKKK
ncbi:MAG TPA: hypothetical protein VNI77_10430 [Nitrososphaera sp.]|nr:hypothetical protein [Nitrososphaera sp.]